MLQKLLATRLVNRRSVMGSLKTGVRHDCSDGGKGGEAEDEVTSVLGKRCCCAKPVCICVRTSWGLVLP